MAKKDTGWRPKGSMKAFGGYEIWDHGAGPHELSQGEVDGEIDFEKYGEDAEDEEGEDDGFPTSVDDLDDEE
ncbi:MAG: hypothetical protein ACOCQU_00335 [Halolamina sp.]